MICTGHCAFGSVPLVIDPAGEPGAVSYPATMR